jgi:hypothetical protein
MGSDVSFSLKLMHVPGPESLGLPNGAICGSAQPYVAWLG